MIFREFYKVARYDLLRVKLNSAMYEYGIRAKYCENAPYITELFQRRVAEVSAEQDNVICVKLR